MEDEVMTVKQVAEYLKVAEHTVYKLIHEYGLPAKKMPTVSGKLQCQHYRILRTALDNWIEKNTVKV